MVALPDELSFEQAALAEPVAYAVHVVEMLTLTTEDVLAVIGMGPIGLFILQAARHLSGAHVYAIDTNPKRLAIAQTLGAELILNPLYDNIGQIIHEATSGFGARAVVDAAGSEATRQSAVSLVCRQGTVIFSGLHAAETNLPINDMVRNEVITRGAFAYQDQQFLRAVSLLAQGAIGLEEGWMVKAPLGEGAYWYEQLLTNPGGIAKVLLVPDPQEVLS